MNNSLTFLFYLARKFLVTTLLILLSLLVVIIMFDMIELFKRALSKNIPYHIVIKLALLKAPYFFEELITFSIMIGTVFSFTSLSKNNEITVFKSLGLSPWKICLPFVASSILLGVLDITVISKLTNITQKELINTENTYYNKAQDLVSFTNNGIWFKENTHDSFTKIIHIKQTNEEGNFFSRVKVYFFDNNFDIKRSLFAEFAELKNGILKLTQVVEHNTNSAPQLLDSSEIFIDINLHKIHKGILDPKSISLLKLPSFILQLQKLGFTTTKYLFYFYQLLLTPFLFGSLSLLGLALSFSDPRSNKVNLMIGISLFLCFIIFFFFKLLSAFALAGKISTINAIIAPIIIFTLVSSIIIMHYEE